MEAQDEWPLFFFFFFLGGEFAFVSAGAWDHFHLNLPLDVFQTTQGRRTRAAVSHPRAGCRTRVLTPTPPPLRTLRAPQQTGLQSVSPSGRRVYSDALTFQEDSEEPHLDRGRLRSSHLGTSWASASVSSQSAHAGPQRGGSSSLLARPFQGDYFIS